MAINKSFAINISNPVRWTLFILFWVFIIALITTTILIFNKYHPVKKFLRDHDNNIRHFKYDANNNKVYFFDSKYLDKAKEITLEEFYQHFSFKPMETEKVNNWLNSLLYDENPSFMLRCQIKLNKYKNGRETYLKVNKVDKENKIIHFESIILSNSYLLKKNMKRFQLANIINYDVYLKNFRLKMFRTKPCQFYYINLKLNAKYANYEKELTKNNVTIKLLGEFLLKNLNKYFYLVFIDNLSMLIIDTKPGDEDSINELFNNLQQQSKLFLSMNNIDEHYVLRIGMAYHPKNSPILPLNEYKANAMEDSNRRFNSIIDSSQYQEEYLKKVVFNSMYRTYFDPIFNFENGEVKAYIVSFEPFSFASKSIDTFDFFQALHEGGLFTNFLNAAKRNFCQRIKGSQTDSLILIPLPLLSVDEFISFFASCHEINPVEKQRLKIILYESEISEFSNDHIQEVIKKLKDNNLGPYLYMVNRPTSIGDTLLSMFDMYLITKNERRTSLIKDLTSRAYTLSTLKSLAVYNKRIVLTKLIDTDECYFAKLHSVTWGACLSLCPPSSHLEVLDLDGQKKINKLNEKIVAER